VNTIEVFLTFCNYFLEYSFEDARNIIIITTNEDELNGQKIHQDDDIKNQQDVKDDSNIFKILQCIQPQFGIYEIYITIKG